MVYDIFNKLFKMKNIFITALCCLGLFSCNGQTKKLNADEIKLIKEINLDQETAEKLKNMSSGNFQVSKGQEEREILFEDAENLKNHAEDLPKAIKISIKAENFPLIVEQFREQLKLKKLILYKSAENYGNEDDVITILQSENKYEPLLFEATNAVNYEIYTSQIIDQLKSWDSKYGIELNGVGSDFVFGEFKNQPNNLHKFAKELYVFCPDIVDQGVGNIKELEKTIKETKGFFLWWD